MNFMKQRTMCVPADSTLTDALKPWSITFCRNTPWAVGLRQMLPMQTKRMEYVVMGSRACFYQAGKGLQTLRKKGVRAFLCRFGWVAKVVAHAHESRNDTVW